jgi:hypothetical protein
MHRWLNEKHRPANGQKQFGNMPVVRYTRIPTNATPIFLSMIELLCGLPGGG